jgi:His/Glu/Gln/Arg/opine family amino acid ABC transporter permease subunit
MPLLRMMHEYSGAYLAGFTLAVAISAIVIVFSIVIGTFTALGRTSRSKTLRGLSAAYVAVFRGIPPLLTLYLVYFGLPSWAASADVPLFSQLLQPLDNRIVAACFALALTSGAYSTEIIRAGIASVKTDQTDAALSIGMTYGLAFRRIVAPQAFRTAFPPLSNEYITVLKATSLASVIGVAELMRAAQLAANLTFQYPVAYSLAGIYYVSFVVLLQVTFHRVERKLSRSIGRSGR